MSPRTTASRKGQLAGLGLGEQGLGEASVEGVLDHPHDLRRAGGPEGDAAGERGLHPGDPLAVDGHLAPGHRCRAHAQHRRDLAPRCAEGRRHLQPAGLGLQAHGQPQAAAVHLLTEVGMFLTGLAAEQPFWPGDGLLLPLCQSALQQLGSTTLVKRPLRFGQTPPPQDRCPGAAA